MQKTPLFPRLVVIFLIVGGVLLYGIETVPGYKILGYSGLILILLFYNTIQRILAGSDEELEK